MDRIYDILNNISKAAAQKLIQTSKADDNEKESPEMEMQEYKEDFYEMSIASIKAIANHANAILAALDNPSVKENITESWLQGRIAITEDYMRTIHDFIVFTSESSGYEDIQDFEMNPSNPKNLQEIYDEEDENVYQMSIGALKNTHTLTKAMIDKIDHPPLKSRLTSAWKDGRINAACKTMGALHDFIMNEPLADDDKTMVAGEKPGLWDNIRKKKEREGKKYRPAKPGDKDRPDPDQWKKLTK